MSTPQNQELVIGDQVFGKESRDGYWFPAVVTFKYAKPCVVEFYEVDWCDSHEREKLPIDHVIKAEELLVVDLVIEVKLSEDADNYTPAIIVKARSIDDVVCQTGDGRTHRISFGDVTIGPSVVQSFLTRKSISLEPVKNHGKKGSIKRKSGSREVSLQKVSKSEQSVIESATGPDSAPIKPDPALSAQTDEVLPCGSFRKKSSVEPETNAEYAHPAPKKEININRRPKTYLETEKVNKIKQETPNSPPERREEPTEIVLSRTVKSNRTSRKQSIFAGWGFLLTGQIQINSAPTVLPARSVEDWIRHLGGTIFETFDEIQKANVEHKVLIAPSPLRSSKYILALMANIPCVKYTWVHKVAELRKTVDFDDGFRLPAGLSWPGGKVVKWVPRTKKLFAGKHIGLFGTSPMLDQVSEILAVADCEFTQIAKTDEICKLGVSGLVKVVIVDVVEFTREFLDNLKEAVNQANMRLLTTEWLFQSVIFGKLQRFEQFESFDGLVVRKEELP